MKLKTLLRKAIGAAMVSYRKRPAHPEIDRTQLNSQRIALVKLDGIGDFVLATGFLNLITKRLPNADITLFCRKPVVEIARQQYPDWTVVELPRRRRALSNVCLDGSARRLLKQQQPFDLLLDLRAFRDMSDCAVSSWIPATTKIALENAYPPSLAWARIPAENRIYDHFIPLPLQDSLKGTSGDLQNHWALARYLFPEEPEAEGLLPRMSIPAKDREATEDLLESRFHLQKNQPFLLACPGAGVSIREYPHLAAVLKQVQASTGIPIVVTGSQHDERTALPLVSQLQDVINLTGVLDLAQHAVLVSMAKAVVCMETSHAHLAGALGTPAVVLIGGGHFGLFAPWGESGQFRWLTNRLPCFGCHWICIYDRPLCIHDIPPETIAKNLIEILEPNA